MLTIIKSLKRWFTALAFTIGFLFFIIVSIPIILDSHSIQKALSGFISTRFLTGIEPDKIAFTIFPSPSIELSDITVTREPLQNSTIEKVVFYLSPDSFFQRKIIVSRITIQNPAIPLSANLLSIPFKGENLFDHLPKEQGDFSVEIKELTSESFKSSDIQIDLSPSRKSVTGKIALNQLNLTEQMNGILANSVKTDLSIPSYSASQVAGQFIFKAIDHWHIDLTLSGSEMSFTGTEKQVIKSDKIICSVVMAEKDLSITMETIAIKPFASSLSVKFKHDRKSGKSSLLFSGREVNVDTVRPAVMKIMPDNFISGKIFDIVQGGIVKEIEVLFQKSATSDLFSGQGIKALFAPLNMTIRGELKKGRINIPATSLTATETDGIVTVQEGILNTEITHGRIGTSEVNKGRLYVDLLHADHDFTGEFGVSADLEHLNGVLQTLLPGNPVSRELGTLRDIHGTTTGTLQLKGKNNQKPSISVSTQDITLNGIYPRLPQPLSITGGKFQYSDDMVTVTSMKGKFGESRFSNLSASLTLDGDHLLKIKSGRVQIALEEVLPWLDSIASMAPATHHQNSSMLLDTDNTPGKNNSELSRTTSILAGIRSILPIIASSTGELTLTETAFEGRLMAPVTWDYLFQGECNNITVRQQPDNVNLSDLSARFLISPSMTRISGGSANIENRALLSVFIKNRMVDDTVKISNAMGLNSTEILSDIRTPFTIKDFDFQQTVDINGIDNRTTEGSGRVFFNENMQLYLSGKRVDSSKQETSEAEVTSSTGVSKTGHVKTDNTALQYQIRISDNSMESATISYDIKKQPSMRFTGSLDTQTIASFFNPCSSTYQSLTSLTEGKKFTVSSTQIDHYTITTDELDLDFLLEKRELMSRTRGKLPLPIFSFTKSSLEETGAPLTHTEPSSPVVITFNCNSFTHKKINLSPFSARIYINGKDKEITIEKMKLCNINGSTTITIKNNLMELFIALNDEKRNIEPVMRCLYHGERLMNGNYSLNASLYSQNTIKNENRDSINLNTLKRNLKGTIKMTSDGGRIFRLTLLSRILSVINISKLMEGKFPDIEQNGFAFNSIKITADVEKGKIILKQAVINGLDMTLLFVGWIDPFTSEIELTCLVAPFKTADSIIKKIPIINTMLGGRLISVPVKAVGTLNNPDVTVLHPSEVAKSVLKTMKDILTTPFKLIDVIQ